MYDDVRQYYLDRGFGGRVGFGSSPALVVIDMAAAWIDPTAPIGSDNVEAIVPSIRALLATAREREIPIFFTTMAFDKGGNEAAGPIGRKLLHMSERGSLQRGERLVELDPRLERREDEVLIEKQRASAFWGTTFGAHLIRKRIDTLIVTGCSTSGCVRATAESAHNENYHTIVVADAVADRHARAHQCNLADIDLRYGDVVNGDAVIKYMKEL
jgi:maleamate amidohydrolase